MSSGVIRQLGSSYNSSDIVGSAEDIFRFFESQQGAINNKDILNTISNTKSNILSILLLEGNEKNFKSDFIKLQYKLIEQGNALFHKIFMLSQIQYPVNPLILEEILGKVASLIKQYMANLNIHNNALDENFFEKIDKESNFAEQIKNTYLNFGDIGTIFFCQECVKQNIFLQEVIEFSQNKKDFYSNNKNDFEYRNYRNILTLASQKENIGFGKALSLSGGASNGLAQLGVIKNILQSGTKVNCITGTSIGAMIGVFLTFGSGGLTVDRINLIEDILKRKFDHNLLGMKNINHIMKIKEIFLEIAKELGINESSTFAECCVPVIVNAGRLYGDGEQQIYLSGDDRILDALAASTNIYGKFGSTLIDGVDVADYATNERGLNTQPLNILGIQDSDRILVDAGYSSETYNSKGARFSKRFFRRAYERDKLEKDRTTAHDGVVINIDAQPSGNGHFGTNFSKEIIENLLDIGEKTTKKALEKIKHS